MTSFVLLASTLGAALVAQTPGLRLIGATGPNPTQLVDGQGVLVHSWPGVNSPSVNILPDGSLLRSVVTPGGTIPGSAGALERRAFDGTLLWTYAVNTTTHTGHHDIEPMPNGNVLVIVWDIMTDVEAVAAGRDPASLLSSDWLPDAILEIEPSGSNGGTIVWEWHIQDHLIQDFDPSKANYGVVADHPELLDINFPAENLDDGDWNHCNGIDYDPINDWIILSARQQSEIYLIDHSTTTAEAAGHTGGARGKGGDFLWRWGNPAAYDSGNAFDRRLYFQHDPRFIPPGTPGAGNLTVFNNSYTGTQSAVVEVEIPVDGSGQPFVDPVTGRFGPAGYAWLYTAPGFNSQFVSSAQRLQNGNTLICSGQQQWLFEVDPVGTIVWSYTLPVSNFIFQAHSVDHRMWADTDSLSVQGGQIVFDHQFDSDRAGDGYLLLGSITGSAPGTMLPNGLLLPLNIDALTTAMASTANTGIFIDTFGTFDANGKAQSTVLLPGGVVPPALVGLQLHFANVVLEAGVAAEISNVATVTLVQ